MKTFIKTFIFFAMIYQGTGLLSAQNMETLEGKVVTFEDIPLNNVEVTSKKTDEKVYTDSLGFFSIRCPENDVLFFEAQGFDKNRIKVKKYNNEVINLVYSNEENSFNQATGNKHISENVLQEAINTHPLKGEKDYSRYNSIYDVIDDEIYTVNVSGTSITTTKRSSFTGSQEVLLVVDNVIVSDISWVSPFNVKSIKYLEGTEAAKYGSRGGNGVIEITLKKD